MNQLASPLPSTRPYLVRALHQWCMDHGFTPYISVAVDATVRVPMQHVVDGEIVLNVSTDATGGLHLGDEFIEFKARFGGVPQQVVVPVDRVSAIYARENGQGMAFPVVRHGDFSSAEPGGVALADDPAADGASVLSLVEDSTGGDRADTSDPPPTPLSPSPRPTLKRIK